MSSSEEHSEAHSSDDYRKEEDEEEEDEEEEEKKQNNDYYMFCKNKNIAINYEIKLHHFGFKTENINLKKVFGKIKMVIFSSSSLSLKNLANKIKTSLGIKFPLNSDLKNMAEASDHIVLYKVRNFLLASHGVGATSMLLCLNDIAKILYLTNASNVLFIKYGTSIGLGVEPGSVVITKTCFNANLEEHIELNIIGKIIKRPAKLNLCTIEELLKIAKMMRKDYQSLVGATLNTMDFYEEQCRLDGAICIYTEEEKNQYLKKIYQMGVRNMEFDSLAFAAFCQKVNIKGGIIGITLADYLSSNQTIASPEQLNEWLSRAEELIVNYIEKFKHKFK